MSSPIKQTCSFAQGCPPQNSGKEYKLNYINTAISRKVVGKSARDNPEMYCG